MSDIITESPYKGLRPFQEADSEYFFGREREIQLVVASLYASPLTLVYGSSGAGKTSVLKAGVLPALRTREDVLPVYFSSWQANSHELLKAAALDASQTIDPKVHLSAGNLSLRESLADLANQVEKRLMIILDQFDEAFLYLDRGNPAFAEIGEAIADENAGIRFLISIREDAVARLDVFEDQLPNLFDCYLRIEPLDIESARCAITEPLKQFHRETGRAFSVEPGLVDQVLSQVRVGEVTLPTLPKAPKSSGTRIDAPYLQLVMKKLWETEVAQDDDVVELKTLIELGGAETIVRSHIDDVMTSLAANERHAAAMLFGYLLTPSGYKIAHSAADLADYTGMVTSTVTSILEKMASSEVRLVKPAGHGAEPTDRPKYEIFHDVLCGPVADWRQRFLRTAVERTHRKQRNLSAVVAVLSTLLVVTVSMFVLDRPSTAPNIVQGGDGLNAIGGFTLAWAPLIGPKGPAPDLTYELEIATNGGEPEVTREILNFTKVSRTSPTGEISWRVRALRLSDNGSEERTDWTELQRITHYPTIWDRICATGQLKVGIGKSDGLFVTDLPETRSAEGHEIELLLDLLGVAMNQDPECHQKAVELRARVVEWAELETLPENDSSIDILASRISITEKRKRWLSFTCPTIEYPPAIMTRRGEAAYVDGHVVRRLGAQYATTNEYLARELLAPFISDLDVVEPNNLSAVLPLRGDQPILLLWGGNESDLETIKSLNDRSIDGIVVDYPFATYLREETLRTTGGLEIHAIENELEHIGFATRHGELALIEHLNKAIRTNPERLATFHAQVCLGDTASICRVSACSVP